MKMTDIAEELKLDYAKKRLADLGDNADRIARRHPWRLAGAAALLGVVIGVLFHRRS